MSEILGFDSRHAYGALMGLIVLERLMELVVARRNLRQALSQGALEVGASHYPWMVTLHTLFLLACPLEVFLLGRPFRPVLGWAALAIVVGTMGLRYWAVTTLGGRWTTRIVVWPGRPPVLGGPYRFLRHPNYLAVILEIAALPLVHGAWLTALVFSVLNGLLLRVRIREEEAALEKASPYFAALGDKPRLIPG